MPEGLLSKEQMVKVLIEVHLNEAKLNQLRVPRDSTAKVYEIMERELLKHQGIEDSVYRKSFQYYLDHPMLMEEVYTVVVDSLSLRERLLNTK